MGPTQKFEELPGLSVLRPWCKLKSTVDLAREEGILGNTVVGTAVVYSMVANEGNLACPKGGAFYHMKQSRSFCAYVPRT